MKLDYHMHFEYGSYDENWVKGFFDSAKDHGLTEIGISEHSHTFPEFKDLYYQDLILDLSSDIWVDIIPLGINKGVAIQKLQKKLNIKPEECVAFGDYLNDYEMMQSVYYSYAMENAIPELKKVARYIAPPNYKNGVVKTIRQLLAQQESNH